MPRRPRIALGGLVYHVLSRAVGRGTLFAKDADFQAFERVLCQAWERMRIRVVSYCLMPDHWHMVLWPRREGELSELMRWLTVTHTLRRHVQHGTSGTGAIYRGRFKSFPTQRNDHFLKVCRYVERSALRANLVDRAEDWRWSSLWRRRNAKAKDREHLLAPSSWPVEPPRNWLTLVNRPETAEELEALRRSVLRGAPFGDDAWRKRTASKLGLTSTLRPLGRPRKTMRRITA